jgi:hypothetical protein
LTPAEVDISTGREFYKHKDLMTDSIWDMFTLQGYSLAVRADISPHFLVNAKTILLHRGADLLDCFMELIGS